MTISKDKMVSLIYELKYDNEDAQLIEKVETDRPLTFLFGAGNMLPHFEENLDGLKQGDAFDFKLNADQAYGPISDQALVDVPKSAFEVDGKIDENLVKLGNSIPMMDAYGNKLNGTVLEINEDTIKMDFNHPLAGEDLHFKGEIIEVRDATPEELMSSSCHSGSCDSGGCGSGGCCGC